MSSSTRYALELSLSGAAAAVAGVRGVGSALGSIGGAVASANQGLFYFAGHLGNISSLAKSMASGSLNLGKSLIGPVADLEGAQIQFETLLGSAQAARDHIQAILDSPISAAFDDADVLAGSRQLMLLGGAALGAGNNLRMVADIAAASGSDFRTAASAVGRLFANIKSGEGAGDSARVFKSMGLAIGDLDKVLEQMSANGATTDALWAKTTETFSRFAGVSDRFAQTFAGQSAALADSWTALKRTIGAPLFDMVRADLRSFNQEFEALLSQDRVKNLMTGLGAVAADGLGKAAEFLTGGIKLTDLVNAAESGTLGDLLGKQLSRVAESLSGHAKAMGQSLGQAIATGASEAFAAKLQDLRSTIFGDREAAPGAGTAVDGSRLIGRGPLNFAAPPAGGGMVTRAVGAVIEAGANYNRAAEDQRKTAELQAEAARQTQAWLDTVTKLASATAGRLTVD